MKFGPTTSRRLTICKPVRETVLAVGHGIINKAIQAVFYKKAMREVPRMANAEIRILDL